MHLNYEFKARTARQADQEATLKAQNPRFVGEDHQVDTYFNVPAGRMKLREGNIENSLIHYDRVNTAGATGAVRAPARRPRRLGCERH